MLNFGLGEIRFKLELHAASKEMLNDIVNSLEMGELLSKLYSNRNYMTLHLHVIVGLS